MRGQLNHGPIAGLPWEAVIKVKRKRKDMTERRSGDNLNIDDFPALKRMAEWQRLKKERPKKPKKPKKVRSDFVANIKWLEAVRQREAKLAALPHLDLTPQDMERLDFIRLFKNVAHLHPKTQAAWRREGETILHLIRMARNVQQLKGRDYNILMDWVSRWEVRIRAKSKPPEVPT